MVRNGLRVPLLARVLAMGEKRTEKDRVVE